MFQRSIQSRVGHRVLEKPSRFVRTGESTGTAKAPYLFSNREWSGFSFQPLVLCTPLPSRYESCGTRCSIPVNVINTAMKSLLDHLFFK